MTRMSLPPKPTLSERMVALADEIEQPNVNLGRVGPMLAESAVLLRLAATQVATSMKPVLEVRGLLMAIDTKLEDALAGVHQPCPTCSYDDGDD